ncbi:WxcM-like domain-containing protein [Chryseobacterium sp. DT-3]|uniref:WxcM-like domain-containing protein n=1 Tax=Chryseobacterium sp. DT-3 TaxID=3396164 RepID=UPI003F1C60CC
MVHRGIQLIKGEAFSDNRGSLFYNNQLDFSEIKKIYIIENLDISIIRAWQGHKIEQRWFLAAGGSFEIKTVEIDDWENPSHDLSIKIFQLKSSEFSLLKVPPGFATSIQALEENSKLLVMSDYKQDEVEDNYKFNQNTW